MTNSWVSDIYVQSSKNKDRYAWVIQFNQPFTLCHKFGDADEKTEDPLPLEENKGRRQ